MNNAARARFAETTVGQPVPKLENREKVFGKSEYIADLFRPGMVHGAILGRAPAHAGILGYDISGALAGEGGVAVITGDDVGSGRMGAFIKDEHAIAKGKVLYVGEPVAAVAAETEAQARAACRFIHVEYEELPAVLSPEEGLAEGAPILHEDLENYFKVFDTGSERHNASRTALEEGDVATAWDDCDIIVEEQFTTHPQPHLATEPRPPLPALDASRRL